MKEIPPIGFRDPLRKRGQPARWVAGHPRQRQYPPPQLRLKISDISHLVLKELFPKVNQIIINTSKSNQQFIRYRIHELFGQLFFENVLRHPYCFLLFFPKS